MRENELTIQLNEAEERVQEEMESLVMDLEQSQIQEEIEARVQESIRKEQERYNSIIERNDKDYNMMKNEN